MSRRSALSPPATAERLLGSLVGAEDRRVVVDELGELYATRCARQGRRQAERWYWKQVAVFALLLARHGRRRAALAARTRFQVGMDERGRRRGGGEMGRWTSEMIHAVRRLSRAPVFTVVAVVTIGVGIGAFSSIFSLVDGVLLDALPYEEPDELAWVWRDYVEADFPRGWLGGPDIAAMMDRPEVFERVVALRSGNLNLARVGGGAPQRVRVHYVTPGLFEALGVRLALGREPTREESVPEGPELVVLSHDLWRTHFGADPDVVGTDVELNGLPTRIVGIAPADFRFVKHGSLVEPLPADAYLPLRTDLADADPGSGAFAALVRVPSDVHPDRVEAALAAAAEPVNAYMAQFDASPVRLWRVGLEEDLIASIRPALLTLVGAATFLLLILAANLATLLLGRAAAREHELGIRIALGAGRPRILSSVLAESGVLTVLGGTLGIALAFLGTAVVVRIAPEDLPRLASVGVDGSVLVVAVVVTAVMAFTTGLTPALYAFRSSLVAALKEGTGRTGRGVEAVRARNALVAVQVALSLMLLVGAGLTGRAFARLLDADPGFDARGTLTFQVPLPGRSYDRDDILRLDAELRERVAALPGVTAVGATTALPLTLSTNQRGISFPGAPGNTGDDQQDEPLVDSFRTTPGYFAAGGHRLLAGRDFSELDADTTSALSIVIDDVLAGRFFPDGSAVGRSALVLGDTATIVGVVDQAHLYTVHADDRGQLYLPLRRFPTTSLSYAVRTTVEPASLVPAVRAVLRELDGSVPLAAVRTLEEIVEASLGRQRLSLTLVASFALGALLLAVLGIYGVVANSVVRRKQEIGVRMALGASGEKVVGLVIGQGVRLAGAGALAGLLGALATSRVAGSLMVGVDAADPLVYGTVGAGLVAVAALASYVPARRATRIDPCEALRPE